jgi:hypothetical protein
VWTLRQEDRLQRKFGERLASRVTKKDHPRASWDRTHPPRVLQSGTWVSQADIRGQPQQQVNRLDAFQGEIGV